MKPHDLQLIYPASEENPSEFDKDFILEIEALKAIGFDVAITPSTDAKRLMLRSFIIRNESDFPKDSRYIQSWSQYCDTGNMAHYLPHIDDISIPSFIVNTIDETVVDEIKRRGWSRAFIRAGMKSLWHKNTTLPVWPDTDINVIREKYLEIPYLKPPYIVRKYIDEDVMNTEDRYWILNHHAYHRSGIIPAVVTETIERMRHVGSTYYVIDATPDFVVELNPGISSDRYGANSPELFASWFAKAFLN